MVRIEDSRNILPRQHRADIAGEACYRSRQREFHCLDGVALQHLHHFQLEAADAILRGGNPGEIPFYRFAKFEFSINLTTAKALGLTIPSTLFATADRVVA